MSQPSDRQPLLSNFKQNGQSQIYSLQSPTVFGQPVYPQSVNSQSVLGRPIYRPPVSITDSSNYLPPNSILQSSVDQKPSENVDDYAADYVPSEDSHQNLKQQIPSDTPTGTATDFEVNKEEYIHEVEHGDTLEGLSLLYSVSISKIRSRNKIDGDAIYYLKQIIIPNPQFIPEKQTRTRDVILEDFLGHMSFEQRSPCTARYYLEEANWEVSPAVRAYKADLQWERANRIQINSLPIKPRGPIYQYRKEIELQKRF